MKTVIKNPFSTFIAGTMACCAFTFSGCSPSLTDGNSSETTNVAIVTSDGKPAAAAKVKLIDAGNWAYLTAQQKSVVLDSAITGPDGTVSFAVFPEATCNLQIDHASSGILVTGFCRNGKVVDATEFIRLKKYAELLGTCISGNDAPTFATLDGTSYRSEVNTDGSFLFPGVAPDIHSLLIGNSTGKLSLAGTAALVEGETLTKDTIIPEYATLLIDDFESIDSTSVLGRIINGYWYTYVDTQDGGHSAVTKTIKQNAPNGTSALNVGMVLGTDTGFGSYAGIGIYIGINKTDWDFSAMRAISFWARGKNTVRISIESRLVDSVQNWPDFGTTITLDSIWKHFSIPVDSFDLWRNSKAEELGITWKSASKKINKIEFEASKAYSDVADSIKLQLDDIRIEGVSASDLFIQAGNTP
jgi:hypothetical protein